jgi:hypothetical protein
MLSTAWSPPAPVASELSSKIPDTLVFLGFDEPGCAFCGHVVYLDGEIVDQMSLNHSFDYLLQEGGLTEEEEATLLKFVIPGCEPYALRVIDKVRREMYNES